jgi:hypothetical protein
VQALMASRLEQHIPKSRKPVWETVEYAISLLIRFWYKAATEAKHMDPKPEATSNKLSIFRLSLNTIKSVLIKKLRRITLGIVEKNAVMFIIEPS